MAASSSSSSNFVARSITELSSLIQLRYALNWIDTFSTQNWDGSPRKLSSDDIGPDDPIADVHILVEKLGFDNSISTKLEDDAEFRHYVKAQLDKLIESWKLRWVEEFGVPEIRFEKEAMRYVLNERVFSIQVTVALKNPFTVLNIEKDFDLPETGDRILMMQHWNQHNYTSRCLDFNSELECCYRAAQHNDLEMFLRLYPGVTQEIDTEDLVKSAVAATVNNVKILEHLVADATTKDFFDNDFTDLLNRAIRDGQEDNVAFLLSSREVFTDVIANIFPDIAGRGWDRLTATLLQKYRDLPRDTIDAAFAEAVAGEHIKVINVLRPRISRSFDYENMLVQCIDGNNLAIFSFILKTFEFSQAQLRQVRSEISQLAVTKGRGKLFKAAIDKYIN